MKEYTIGNAVDFSGLTPEEEHLVEIRVALYLALKDFRHKNKLTQVQLAKKLGSSQSRVAKMEAGDTGVSLDLLLHGLLASGATPKDIAKVIAKI
jgi:transcriptional regulator with XRE-family HTH domain